MLVSPEKVKFSCWLLVMPVVPVVPVVLVEVLAPEDDERNSIQGTATCLPLELERLLELDPGLELELSGLVPGVVELLVPEELPLGLEPAPEAPELSDRIANSIRPELGLRIKSLMVPSVSPVEPATLAPVS